MTKKERAKWCAESWKDPEIRRKRLENRSKNKSWLASRRRCAQVAAKALHTVHRDRFLAGRKKQSVTMHALYANPDWKYKHDLAASRVCRSSKQRELVSKAREKAFADGTAVAFWKYAPGTKVSKIEKKVVSAIKSKGLCCRPQFSVPGTRYTADVLVGRDLIVEVDGHPSHYQDARVIAHGKVRDKKLKELGYRVLHLKLRSLARGAWYCASRVQAVL